MIYINNPERLLINQNFMITKSFQYEVDHIYISIIYCTRELKIYLKVICLILFYKIINLLHLSDIESKYYLYFCLMSKKRTNTPEILPSESHISKIISFESKEKERGRAQKK